MRSSSQKVRDARSSNEVILLAVTGMSPTILTETVWALAQESPPVLPDRIVVLTTSAGKQQIIRELFTRQAHFNNQSGWDCLRAKLEEQGHDTKRRLRFDPDSDDLRVLTIWDERSRRKTALSDIRTAAENEAVADSILEFVRGIVESPDIHLIASIAGGRKTMGTLLYACMTLIGRETDRVTHVLVDEPFDDPRLEPKFYFPEQPNGELASPQKKRIQAKDARIVLADLPFVPIRNLFTKEFGRMPGRFMALVAQYSHEARNRAASDLKLVVHRSRPVIEVNGVPVKLTVKEHLLFLFLADRLLQNQPPFGSYADGEKSLNEYRQQLRSSAPADDFSDWRWQLGGSSNFDDQDIRHAVSSLSKKLRRATPDAEALIDRLPKHGRLSIDLPRNQISIVD